MTPLTATTTTATTPVAAEAVRTTAPAESAAPAASPGTTPAADRAGAGDGSPPLDQLDALEAEAIAVVREAVAECRRPVLLFSGGKDSVVVLHLARKAFWPAPVPFPLLHVDTGHNFPEVLAYRDAVAERLGMRLIIARVQDYIDDGRLRARPGSGTRATSAPSCGPCSIRATPPASTCASSRCRTGPSWTCGATSSARASPCRACTTPMSARSSSATACGWR